MTKIAIISAQRAQIASSQVANGLKQSPTNRRDGILNRRPRRGNLPLLESQNPMAGDYQNDHTKAWASTLPALTASCRHAE